MGTVLLVLGLVLGAGAARAFDPAKTPAKAVESSRWGALEPSGNPIGDTTGFAFHRDPRQTEPFYFAVDIENGWVFVPTGRGLQIYNANVNPGQPSLSAYGYGPNPSTQGSGGLMPVWYHSDEDFFLREADAPEGVDSIVAVASFGQGVTIWDTSKKDAPSVHYQDDGVGARGVYAATFGNKKYAVAISSGGAFLYDLDEAAKKSKCLDSSNVASLPCGGVYKGKFGTVAAPNVIHGVGPYVAFGTARTFEIWNASNPTAPFKVMESAQPARGIAMWQQGNSYYLALGNSGKVRIYDVSCIQGGICSLPIELKVLDVPNGTPPISRLTFSRATGGVPYLYVSGEDSTSCAVQREYLFNVSNPLNPVEITPDPTPAHPGGYWGWYYYGCDTGYNWVSPMAGKFYGNYFYRAAYSIMDVHKLVGAQKPTANFSWQDPVYAGVPVQFTDQSSGTPAPDQWDWSFGLDGSPATALELDPVPPTVTFLQEGTKTVSLKVHSAEGWSPAVPKTVTVLDPKPKIGSVTVSPASPVRCQPITFTATGVTGLPALTHSWSLPNAVPAPGATNGNPLQWNTTASTAPGTYTATLTVSNAHGSAQKSVSVLVGDLQTINPAYTPTNLPFTAGTVKFDDNQPAGSATEWSWDFDDDENPATSQWTAWSNDPINGPSPTHSYTKIGVKNVRARVKNCTTPDQATGIVSGALQVTILQVTPLKANFSPVCPFNFCAFNVGQTVTFLDGSTGAEVWDYDWDGDGSYEDANNTAAKTTHVYTKVGDYIPRLKVRRGASEQDIYIAPVTLQVGAPTPGSIQVNGPSTGSPNQALSFNASGGGSCQPAASGWAWSSPGGTITSGTTDSVTISWNGNGTKTVSVTNSACSGVSGSKTVTIGSTPPPPPPPPPPGGLKAEFSYSPTAPAANQAVSFNGAASTGSPSSYTWDFGDGSAFGSGAQVSHTYTAIGTYTVQLIVTKPGNCAPAPFCDSVATKTITVGTGEPPLSASFQSNASCITDFGFNVCTAGVGQTVAFTSTSTGGPTAWSWAFGDGQSATGAAVNHTFNQPGTFTVTLTVGKGSNTASASMTFNVSGEAPLGASFQTNAACSGNTCTSGVGQAVTFTSTSTGNPVSQSWSFGDGGNGNGGSVTHTFQTAGTFTVTLNIGKGANSASASKTFNVSGVVQPEASTIVLPWVAQSRGVLQQTSNLYIHNPGATAMEVVLEFRRQGTPEANPPRAALTIQPGATQYVVDVLKGLFKVENTVGFVTITKTKGDRNPVMTSFNTVTGKKGSQYGQTIPGVALSREGTAAATTGSRMQYLVGLNDNSDRQAYFGITNPNPEPAVYRLKFVDSLGRPIGNPSSDLTLPSFGARQYQLSEIRSQFGITTEDDYRVEVETVSGKQLYPYGTNVQTVSKDPSYQGAGQSQDKLYLIGAMRTKGLNKSEWQSDIVLSNTGSGVALADVSFLNAGPTSQPTAPLKVTLQAGQTDRLENVGKSWNVKDSVGLLIVESNAPGGLFPVVQGESYLSTSGKPGSRYGLAMAAFTDEDAAGTGQGHYLVGLRHDSYNRTTLWVYNPSNEAGNYDLIYRGLDGKVLGRIDNVAVGAGKMRQFNPSQHPLKAVGKKGGGVPGGFTIQVVVKSGKVLAAAQVVNNKTNDPAYVQGQAQ
jgi:PKD repeat protein